jgi:hypothetical protein
VQRYEDGQKQRYFADDDDMDLAALVKRTKYGGCSRVQVQVQRRRGMWGGGSVGLAPGVEGC